MIVKFPYNDSFSFREEGMYWVLGINTEGKNIRFFEYDFLKHFTISPFGVVVIDS